MYAYIFKFMPKLYSWFHESLISTLGNLERCVTDIVERNKDTNLNQVIQNIFSHSKVSQKNILVIKLIVRFFSASNWTFYYTKYYFYFSEKYIFF